MAAAPPNDEGIYLECVLRSGLLQVSAIDPKTGTEVSVFGPANGRQALMQMAVAKLKMMLKKHI